MPVTVYAAPFGVPGADPGDRQPAFRAWADALLVRLSSVPNTPFSTSTAARGTGRIARSKAEAPFIEPLIVEPSACAVATPSARLQLFTPSGWSEGLVQYLRDQGIDADVVAEHLPVCAAPLWPTRTEALPEVMMETRGDLLLLIERYFADDARRYLDSWHPMGAEDLDTEEQLEVVVLEPRLEAEDPRGLPAHP